MSFLDLNLLCKWPHVENSSSELWWHVLFQNYFFIYIGSVLTATRTHTPSMGKQRDKKRREGEEKQHQSVLGNNPLESTPHREHPLWARSLTDSFHSFWLPTPPGGFLLYSWGLFSTTVYSYKYRYTVKFWVSKKLTIFKGSKSQAVFGSHLY